MCVLPYFSFFLIRCVYSLSAILKLAERLSLTPPSTSLSSLALFPGLGGPAQREVCLVSLLSVLGVVCSLPSSAIAAS